MDNRALSLLHLNGRMVDLQRGSVTDESRHVVTLRPQAAEVLRVLAAKPGEIVTKDELMQAVWGKIAVTDDSLVQCIIEIRKALGDDKHKIVRTLPKRGYVLEGGAGGGQANGIRSFMLRRQFWLGLAAGLVILIGAGAYLLPTTKSKAEPPAIAVLPFENIGGDEKWGRFAVGVTEDIITDLAQFRDIPVIARTSTEVYRGKAHDVREIGRALNVKYVLEGSLQVDGHRMRVTAQLINAGTGAHVWSERYDRPAAELLDVQDEITHKIAATLVGWQGQVAEAERAQMRRKNATDLDAYDHWLLGIEAKHRMTPESQVEARAHFEKGLTLAPDFVPILRDIGLTHIVDIDIGSAVDFRTSMDAFRKYSERALRLDPNDATAHLNMSSVVSDTEQAEHYRERALQLAPNNPDILMQLAWACGGQQPERAIALVERTLRLNPRYPSWWNFPIAQAYFAARRFDKAYAAAKQIGESPNQTAFLAMSAAQLGKTQEASEAAANVLRMKPDWTAESMFPYPKFRHETLLPEGAAKAGLPVCMTPGQIASYSGVYRLEECEEERAKADTAN
ncbi:winged helix-turn-helix domain-containing protein [Mesorhizobium sp. M9A.F.Ca.ET.002.03.1.2]|uniref:winged helix-turn-helix domain-containing protein n=1 Tax=Mesorhizobium sp. M9A.F.Ca.ET.002.03.1.2 TaxID=2493668 RepID=UPI00167B4654|nr:winged helix-turn-helix domain-containing protein [Mesorhizobium sp. M9A.F.Ca.ET.002.03.1.2]